MTVINYIYVINKRKYIFFILSLKLELGLQWWVWSIRFCLHVHSHFLVWSPADDTFLLSVPFFLYLVIISWIITLQETVTKVLFLRKAGMNLWCSSGGLAWFSSWHVRLVISDIMPRVVSEMSSALIGIMLNSCKVNGQ